MDVQELKERIDLAEYVGQYVDLDDKTGILFGLCPFHKEDTPSFAVNPDGQYFHCFGCNAGGDVIEFARRYHKVGYHKALEMLCEYVGVESLKDTDGRSTPSALQVMRQYKHLRRQTHIPSPAVPDGYMDRFPFDLAAMQSWVDEGIRKDQLRKYQVRFDQLSQRIVYPVRDPFGKMINVAGRTVIPNFKEQKLRKYSYYFSHGSVDTLYALYENQEAIQNQKEVVVFEGAKSVMKAEVFGVPNAVALLTSHVSAMQLYLLVALQVPVVFALDSEVDPRADKNIQKLKHFARCYWVKNQNSLLKDKEAPVDEGIEVWKSLYERRVPI